MSQIMSLPTEATTVTSEDKAQLQQASRGGWKTTECGQGGGDPDEPKMNSWELGLLLKSKV